MRRPFYYINRGDIAGLVGILDSVDINLTDVEGQSLLHAASVKDVPVDIARELVRRRIDINRQDHRGRTALAYAAAWGRRDVAEVILDAGGRQDIADEHGNQPLWVATGRPHRDHDFIKMLLRRGADPSHRNRYGRCPLDIARDRGIDSLARIFEGAGPVPPSEGGLSTESCSGENDNEAK